MKFTHSDVVKISRSKIPTCCRNFHFYFDSINAKKTDDI